MGGTIGDFSWWQLGICGTSFGWRLIELLIQNWVYGSVASKLGKFWGSFCWKTSKQVHETQILNSKIPISEIIHWSYIWIGYCWLTMASGQVTKRVKYKTSVKDPGTPGRLLLVLSFYNSTFFPFEAEKRRKGLDWD